MRLVFIRHAHAVEAAPVRADEHRWLTAKGRRVARKVGSWLAKLKRTHGAVPPKAIWTSPLVRSVQTAEILATELDLDDNVEVCPELAIGRDPGDLLRLLAAYTGPEPLALVGHEPSLSLVATSLLEDPAWPGFKKGGVLGLDWDGWSSARRVFDLNPRDL